MKSVKAGLHEVMWRSHAVVLLRRLDAQPDLLRVLLYHRVDDLRSLGSGDPNLISATPAAFEAQMNYLVRYYCPIEPRALLDAIQNGTPLPPRAVLVTFDDGYRDFQTYAWPILRHHQIPAVLFVPTAFPGSGRTFWWDALHGLLMATRRPAVTFPDGTTHTLSSDHDRRAAVRRLNAVLRRTRPEVVDALLQQLQEICEVPQPQPSPMLGWDELRRLSGDGLTVASHTQTHPAIPTLTQEEIEREVRGSQADLRRELGEAVPMFSYPLGMADPRADDVLSATGVLAAFTAAPGRNRMGRSALLHLRRRAINGSRSFADFSLSLISFYSWFQERSADRIRSAVSIQS